MKTGATDIWLKTRKKLIVYSERSFQTGVSTKQKLPVDWLNPLRLALSYFALTNHFTKQNIFSSHLQLQQ
jgi:hypothetical protein